MRNDEDGTVVFVIEIILEPLYAVDVKVIRRFIKKEQVWLFKEKLGEGRSTFLTAAEDSDRKIEIQLVEPQSAKDPVNLMLVIVAAEAFVLFLNVGIACEEVWRLLHFHLFCEQEHLIFKGASLLKNFEHLLP